MVVVVEAITQAHGVGRLFRILTQVHVVPTGGVLEQIDDSY